MSGWICSRVRLLEVSTITMTTSKELLLKILVEMVLVTMARRGTSKESKGGGGRGQKKR